MKSRGNEKSIQFLQKDDGTIVNIQKDIEDELLDLYRNLIGKVDHKISHINVDAMRRGKQIGMDHSNFLINQVINDEIIKALKGIGDLKSPGVDVYGSNSSKLIGIL